MYGEVVRSSGSQIAGMVEGGWTLTEILVQSHGWEGDEVREVAADLGYAFTEGGRARRVGPPRHDPRGRPEELPVPPSPPPGPHHRVGGASTSQQYEARLAAAGVTVRELRTWAREHGVPCPARGRYVWRALAAYEAAHPPERPVETVELPEQTGPSPFDLRDLLRELDRLVEAMYAWAGVER